jgi:hypothetical protein
MPNPGIPLLVSTRIPAHLASPAWFSLDTPKTKNLSSAPAYCRPSSVVAGDSTEGIWSREEAWWMATALESENRLRITLHEPMKGRGFASFLAPLGGPVNSVF